MDDQQAAGVYEEPDSNVVSIFPDDGDGDTDVGPPEGGDINIVMRLDDDVRGALGQQCWDRWDRASRSREPHMERCKRWMELYALVRREKHWPFRNCANITTPLLAAAVLHTHATLYDMMVPGEGQLYYSKPTTPGDEEMRRANVTELVLNHYIRSRIPNYEIGLDDSLWQLILFGSMFRRIVWSERDVVITADSVSIDDLVVPYSCKVLDPMMLGINGYTWVQYLEPDELEERIADDYYENADKVSLRPEAIDRSSFRQSADEIAGSEPPFDDEDGRLQVFDHFFRMKLPDDIEGGGWHYVTATVDERSKSVLRLVLRERTDPRTGKKKEVPNFVHYKGFPSDGYYGMGFGDFVGPLNDAQNTVLNQFIDAMTLQNAGGGFVSSTMKSQKGEIVLQPGVYQPINAPASAIRDGIYHHEFRPPNPVALEVTERITEMSNRVTVQSEVLSGETGSDRQTATEVKIKTEMVLKQVSVFMRRVKNSQKAEGRIFWDILALNLDEKEASKVVNADGEPEVVQVSRADFIPDANVQPVADPTVTSRTQRIEQATQLYGLLKQDPLTMANPAISYAAVSDVLTAYGDYAKRKMLGPPPTADKPSPPMPAYDENYAMSMGKAMPIHDEDDHDQHLIEHERYEKTPAYQAAGPQTWALHHHHTGQHLAAQERLKQERLHEQPQPLLRLVSGGPQGVAGPPANGPIPGAAPPDAVLQAGGGGGLQPRRRAGKGRGGGGAGKRNRPGDSNAGVRGAE